VRFLLDENLSPLLAQLLITAGHDAVHVRAAGLASAADDVVMNFAREHALIVISADTDFGELLARSSARTPSVILLRRQGNRRTAEIAEIILANLNEIEVALDEGAIVVFDQTRIRIRRLPLDQPTSDP
jgi:predicted nuclease of predicted toxin-antitoxin system